MGLIPNSASLMKSNKRLGTTKIATLGYSQGLGGQSNNGSTNLKAKENTTSSVTTP